MNGRTLSSILLSYYSLSNRLCEEACLATRASLVQHNLQTPYAAAFDTRVGSMDRMHEMAMTTSCLFVADMSPSQQSNLKWFRSMQEEILKYQLSS